MQELVSDGGPEFDNTDMKNLASSYGFEYNGTSPNYPQSNGQAESGVKIIKNIMRKCAQSPKSDIFIAILEYANTPNKFGLSPAQKFFGRPIRSIIPTTVAKLKPLNDDVIQESLAKAKNEQKHYYDQNTRPLRPLKV